MKKNFPELEKIESFSRYSSRGAVFFGGNHKSMKTLLKQQTFEGGNARWIDEVNTVTKEYKKTKPSRRNFTPLRASVKNNENYGY